MLFAAQGDRVLLPDRHPLCVAGRYPAAALVELAAQLAGGQVDAPAGAPGVLVEVTDCALLGEARAGDVLLVRVLLERRQGPLWRFWVELSPALRTRLTLRIS
jgi:hypothetical protein